MYRHFVFALIALLFTACQKNETPQESHMFGGMPVVQSADGTTYSVSCLQEQSSQISRYGETAMAGCAIDLETATVAERGRFTYGSYNGNTSYAWIYNPSTYCPPTYYNYNYPTYYNPYSDSRFKNDSFCAFVFGKGTSFNCYYLFGYTNPSYSSNYNNYSSNYNSKCSQCLYSWKCASTCWDSYSWY